MTITAAGLDRLERTVRERIDALEEKTAIQRDADAMALKLNAIEVERRLLTLNHENARVAKVLDESIPREVFESYKTTQATATELARKETQIWKDQVNNALTVQGETASQSAVATARIWALITAITVTALNLIITLLLRQL